MELFGALIFVIGIITGLYIITLRLEKIEEKIRTLESALHFQNVITDTQHTQLKAFVERWAGDPEMDNPDWHKGE